MDWIRSFGPKTKRFNLYDTTGIKQELDKTIISVVSSDKDFYKDNFYINLKIILGFTSLGVAGLVYSFSCPTQQCQVKTFVSVITFFLLSLLGPWFIQSWENKAIVFGTLHNYKVRIETKLGRYDNCFEATIEVVKGTQQKQFQWTVPYNNYFNTNGVFLEQNFQAAFLKFYEDSKANTY
ncbi:uncharacterized protein Gasu_32430 [Galdieria sulphuraria]|uniref:Signal peptidase complex subunit 2 n=1 Tax=Galdieria sulphuraria TaxID=130081 RepID=M2XH76_GALSU|nr:uncharacterized protein Gasu_32430 [Galdieria sulphuraria]EME29422.1 hypothetical protein Gasu_32430 [Galdieria sulphuraria]|eukprot:XP_005705942.1 hypothetical protein Gasu_32430 [Galdieria sulphuraria]